MKDSDKRIKFISEYISAYEAQIELLNRYGLFDSAKLFELFAIEVGTLYLGQPLYNLNVGTFTYPFVDLRSEDKSFYVQVSTVADIPTKIKDTLERIRDSEKPEISEIKKVKFFCLSNDSEAKVKDLIGTSQIGNIPFVKENDLLTTNKIVERAINDLEFQLKLYELLQKEQNRVQENLSKWNEAIDNSRVLISVIDSKINNEYEIDRTDIIDKIKQDACKNISIQGNAGSGKSALCKKLVESEPFVIYARAERFLEESNINNVWGFNVRETLKYLNNKKEVVFFIDALEFIADYNTKLDLLNVLYDSIKDYPSVKLITSCRTSDKGAFIKLEGNYAIKIYELPDLTDEQQNKVAEKYPVIKQMMGIESYKELLSSPFYLNIIATKITNIDNIEDENQLREYIWENIICLSNPQYKNIVNSIVFSRAKTSSAGVDVGDYDLQTINKLISEGVLIKNSSTIRLKYDIFEDICFEQYFNSKFDKCKGNYQVFFEQINTLGQCIFRRYQIWIENKLLAKSNREKFLYELIFSDKMPIVWKEQTQIGLVKSRHSDSFFLDYGDTIIEKALLVDFIKYTNLYAFTINSDLISRYVISLNPSGVGRKSLIHLIAKREWYKNNPVESHIISKLCSDYVVGLNIEQGTAEECVAILGYMIDSYFSNGKRVGNYLLQEKVNGLLKSIYKIAQYAKDYITAFWNKIISWFQSGISDKVSDATEIIEYTLKYEHIYLAKYLPKELCALAELFWTYTPIIKNSPYALMSIDERALVYQYGLSIGAEHYEFGADNNDKNFFFALFRTNFMFGLHWAINFINNAIDALSKKVSGKLPQYTIFFVDDGIYKDFIGFEEMWLVTSLEHSMPLLISDLIYSLKCEIESILKDVCKDNNERIMFANKVKKILYEQSNNIALLTIISDIGIEFERQLPGYAIDLNSNIYIVLNDLTRAVGYIKNPVKEQLEKNILLSVGLSHVNKRYKNAVQHENLMNYFINMLLSGDDALRSKCYQILDYLYSVIPNDEEHVTEYLQIEKMDVRKSKFTYVDTEHVAIMPTITGAARNLVEEQERVNKPESDFAKLINDWGNKLQQGNYDVNELVRVISSVQNIMKNSQLPFSYENILIMLMSYALSHKDLKLQYRNSYCVFWIDGINRILNMGSFNFDIDLMPILFAQLKEKTNKKVIKKIKKLMLDCILFRGPNGIIHSISNHVHNYLFEDDVISRIMFNTIVKLSEDEMEHEKFNAEYLVAHTETDDDFTFVPNMQPKLSGVDYHIKERRESGYISKRDEIINRYLFDEMDLDLTNFEMAQHDIGLMSYALNCREFFMDDEFAAVVKKYISEMIEMFNATSNSYNSNQVLGYYQTHEVQRLLQRALLIYPTQTEVLLNVMFDDIDFSIFNSESIEFYQETFSTLLPHYFDSHDNKEKRAEIANIINKLENKVRSINNLSVREDLYKILILSPGRFGGLYDWSQFQAEYSYQDKQFLNSLFCKYGCYHLGELIDVVYKLHIDKLLPDVIISIKNAFQKYTEYRGIDSFIRIIKEKEVVVLLIVTKAFLDFSDQIKEDTEITESYMYILTLLRDIGYAEAAVILDEFMKH